MLTIVLRDASIEHAPRNRKGFAKVQILCISSLARVLSADLNFATYARSIFPDQWQLGIVAN